MKVSTNYENVTETTNDESLILEEFRKKMEIQDFNECMHRIKELIQNNKIKDFVVHFISNGFEKMISDNYGFYQNIGIVAALLGAISVTLLLSTPSRSDTYSTSVNVSHDAELALLQSYYFFWALATFSEIAVVVIVTIANVHLSLMVTKHDFLWFFETWDFQTKQLSQVFLVTGCISLVIGCCIGAFLFGDINTGIIVTVVGGVSLIVIVSIWLYMLYFNKVRQKASTDKIIQQFMAS